jgi:hypothetical protein
MSQNPKGRVWSGNTRDRQRRRNSSGALMVAQTTFFVEGIRKLVDRWTKCIEKEEDYAEK